MLTNEPASQPTNRDPERGSVIMAMLVLMIVGAIAITMFTFSQTTVRGSIRQEEQRQVVDALDAAVAEASARIELGEVESFSGYGTIDEVGYRYEATMHWSLSWSVTAFATLNSTTVGPISRSATVNYKGEYIGESPYALFVTDLLELSSPDLSLSQPIGSYGTIKTHDDAADLEFHLFEPGGTCENCTSAIDQSETWTIDQPEIPEEFQECPLAKIIATDDYELEVYGFLDTIDGRDGVPFRCTLEDDGGAFGHFPTVIYETVQVENPPVIIHVDEGVTLWFLRADVNTGGDPRDFIIEAGGGPSTEGDYNYGELYDDGITMTGVLNAPSRELTVENDVSITGRVTIGALTQEAGSLRVIADPRVVDTSVAWTASEWHATSS